MNIDTEDTIFNFESEDKRPQVQLLFKNLKKELPRLKKLLKECNSHWGYEDKVYRFYHASFKVYGLQSTIMNSPAGQKVFRCVSIA